MKATATRIATAHTNMRETLTTRSGNAVFLMRSVPPCRSSSAALYGAARAASRRADGASPRRAWREVDGPILARGALVGAGFAFAVSLGEFGATLFIARPDTVTIPVAIPAMLGTALLAQDEVETAQRLIERVFEDDSPEGHALFATLHLKRGDCEGALVELEKARAGNPELRTVNYLSGVCLMQGRSDWEGAAAAFRRATTYRGVFASPGTAFARATSTRGPRTRQPWPGRAAGPRVSSFMRRPWRP